MTTRSTRSALSAKERMTDGDVYVFLLQNAVLSWTIQSKLANKEASNSANNSQNASIGKKGGGEASASAAQSNATSTSRGDWMSLGGLADMVRDVSGSNKSVRFPEKFLKRMGERLEQIAMGRDPNYRDQSLRRTIGVFYGTFKEASFQKQLKENRKVEDLILNFVTSAQSTLSRTMDGDAWKEELDKQVGIFVRIIRDCLRSIHGVSRELLDRLDGYSNKLAPGPTSLSQQQSQSPSNNGATGPTTPNVQEDNRRGSTASSLHANATSNSATNGSVINDSVLIRTVGILFKVDQEQLLRDVDFMRKTCTEKNAMIDLKRCVQNINLQAAWPGRKEDFETEEGYQQWRSNELQSLSQTMMEMCKANPELLKITSSEPIGANAPSSPPVTTEGNTPSIDASVSQSDTEDSTLAGDAEEEASISSLTFVPPDPKAYYRRALEMCIDYDLEQIRIQPEEEEVSLSILSQSHIDLLTECALRWRIMPTFRATSNLDVIKYKYDRGEVPLDCISEALSSIDRTIAERNLTLWTKSDRRLLFSCTCSLFDSCIRFIHDAFQDLQNIDVDEVQPFVSLVTELHDAGLVRTDADPSGEVVDLDGYAEDLKDRIRILAIHDYTAKTTDIFSQRIDNEVAPLLDLLDWIEKGAKKMDKKYPDPILGRIDPVSLILEKQASLFLDDLESMKHQIVEHARRDRDSLPFDDVFRLYDRTGDLLRMHSAFCPEQKLNFNRSDWFEPHIQHWLMLTEKKTAEWVNNALSSDSFIPIDSEGAVHSSSIDDLFGALQQPLDFILSLQWPDAYQNARFLTSMARTISRSIEQYCAKVEEMFMEEMFPRTSDGQEKQSAWMVKAKQTLQGEKKVEPFHFQTSTCVKLNNVEAARILLDKIYNKVDADTQARIIGQNAPKVPDKRQKQRYIFTVKVVLGENLQPVKDSSANARIDSFVTLSDERGAKIAKTRTIYETPDPRWDETFDIPVEGNLWLAATVWDRKLVGDHNLCGRAYLRLDPRYFNDFLNHELWLNLDTQGRLLMRVSMEGEKDDILFYFGRAFRSLKRAESDMIRIIVDKMSVFIRQCLSRSVLKSLVKTSGINLDKALGNVKALYAQALASTNVNASMIPPIESEMPKKQRPQQLTDHEIEAAISPLFDYLEECLGTLKSSLSDDESLLVLTKVWKEVLNTIECILLPPLSDGPSDMTQLSGKEVEVVFKWLSMLRNYFNAYDDESGIAHGVPLEVLQGPKYREIVSYTLFHDAPTDDLMESCVREMQKRLRRAPSKRVKNKSVLQQRSLGTIKKRKADKKNEEQNADDNLDVILRLLRMRPNTTDFLQQQFSTMGRLQAAMGTMPPTNNMNATQQFPHPHMHAQASPLHPQMANIPPSYPQQPARGIAPPPSYNTPNNTRPSLNQRLSKTLQQSTLDNRATPPASPMRESRQFYQ
ncbi:uncharacterized protein FA14DRAFT_168557 [Meira miltonrushii]|uniref:C2 domain-containing protein n=1 Tax=Meira miltonrushii TaxID=1280837 RepID=A0A316VDG1_9BASI|nr:uncharacterized protein FA14DRAFT_168557 [Meira miltonrushii]PWN34293.1 hypothetical protein FA14DRAFT_168557 [Meira miltonrushii]